MKIESQVCNLEQARKLNELKICQQSIFYWKYQDINKGWLLQNFATKGKSLSAFTVAELGCMLPDEIHIPYKGNSNKKRKYAQHIHYFKQIRFSVNYTGGGSREFLTQTGNTEAEARATMLIYLLENNLITAKEVNARL